MGAIIDDSDVRVLALSDTHIGFDSAERPRSDRQRRDADFHANHLRALAPALRGEVDVVIHGDDLLYRRRVSDAVLASAFDPLIEVAERGVPALIVPGNHERGSLPHTLFTDHPNLHIFDRPCCVDVLCRATAVRFAGFPYRRGPVRGELPALLAEAGWRPDGADRHVLCVHQLFAGATVGLHNYTFRGAADVIRPQEVPAEFDVVVSGYVHRHQVLGHARDGTPLATPVVFPGSIERTAFAEAPETKGFCVVTLRRPPEIEFRPLPARPMHFIHLPPAVADDAVAVQFVTQRLAPLDPTSVVRVSAAEDVPDDVAAALAAPRLRALAPATMYLELRVDAPRPRSRSRPRR